MRDSVSAFIEETFQIRGIFKKEVYGRFPEIIELIIANGLEKEDIKTISFGLHYFSINIPDELKRKTFFGMVQDYEEDFKSLKMVKDRIIAILPEPEAQYVTIQEPVKRKLPKGVSIDEMLKFIKDIKQEFPESTEVSCGTVNIVFKTPLTRMEDNKELIKRLIYEDAAFIKKYKHISEKLKEAEALKEYME